MQPRSSLHMDGEMRCLFMDSCFYLISDQIRAILLPMTITGSGMHIRWAMNTHIIIYLHFCVEHMVLNAC